VEGEALDVGEHARAQVQQEALADPGREVVVAERDQPAEQREADVGERDDQQRLEILGDQPRCDGGRGRWLRRTCESPVVVFVLTAEFPGAM